ncbi:MAG: response regulator [Comamonadaceae bacterium]|nr:response regulator [Comamonadaceae bacterium]
MRDARRRHGRHAQRRATPRRRGAAFRLALPLAAPQPLTPAPDRHARTARQRRPSPLIHLVDDDAAVRDSARAADRHRGPARADLGATRRRSSTASTARPSAPSCSTCACPALSGLDGARDAAAPQGVDQPVVMLTGHGTVDLCRRAFKAGAAEFLEKPVDDELLLEALQQRGARSTCARASAHAADREARERYARLSRARARGAVADRRRA